MHSDEKHFEACSVAWKCFESACSTTFSHWDEISMIRLCCIVIRILKYDRGKKKGNFYLVVWIVNFIQRLVRVRGVQSLVKVLALVGKNLLGLPREIYRYLESERYSEKPQGLFISSGRDKGAVNRDGWRGNGSGKKKKKEEEWRRRELPENHLTIKNIEKNLRSLRLTKWHHTQRTHPSNTKA